MRRRHRFKKSTSTPRRIICTPLPWVGESLGLWGLRISSMRSWLPWRYWPDLKVPPQMRLAVLAGLRDHIIIIYRAG
jgi:hypothetical protein